MNTHYEVYDPWIEEPLKWTLVSILMAHLSKDHIPHNVCSFGCSFAFVDWSNHISSLDHHISFHIALDNTMLNARLRLSFCVKLWSPGGVVNSQILTTECGKTPSVPTPVPLRTGIKCQKMWVVVSILPSFRHLYIELRVKIGVFLQSKAINNSVRSSRTQQTKTLHECETAMTPHYKTPLLASVFFQILKCHWLTDWPTDSKKLKKCDKSMQQLSYGEAYPSSLTKWPSSVIFPTSWKSTRTSVPLLYNIRQFEQI